MVRQRKGWDTTFFKFRTIIQNTRRPDFFFIHKVIVVILIFDVGGNDTSIMTAYSRVARNSSKFTIEDHEY